MKKSEMAATIDRLTVENQAFRIAVAHAIQRPDCCSAENLARYVEKDFAYLRAENARLKEQIKLKRSVEIGDDR